MNLFNHLRLPVEWGMAMRFAQWTDPAWNSFANGAGAKRQRHRKNSPCVRLLISKYLLFKVKFIFLLNIKFKLPASHARLTGC
jgi:hypothetical protein